MTTKHAPGPVFISRDQVLELNEKHGWFQYGDAQSDVSNTFANEAIARYERIRSAAPDLLEALQAEEEWRARDDAGALDPEWDYDTMVASKRRAAIAKAKGEQQ